MDFIFSNQNLHRESSKKTQIQSRTRLIVHNMFMYFYCVFFVYSLIFSDEKLLVYTCGTVTLG